MVASSYPGWKEETSPGTRLVEGWKGTFIRECPGLKVGVNARPELGVGCRTLMVRWNSEISL